MPEVWDIYDRNRALTGRTILRGDPMTEDEYHLVVSVWIRNSMGEWLLSRRAQNKSHPLKWEPVGGSVLAGEASLSGALREVQEELGIALEKETGRLYASFRRDKVCWENPGFLDIWYFEIDIAIDKIVLQEEETCGARWASEKEILRMIESGEFVPTSEFPYHEKLFAWSKTI